MISKSRLKKIEKALGNKTNRRILALAKIDAVKDGFLCDGIIYKSLNDIPVPKAFTLPNPSNLSE